MRKHLIPISFLSIICSFCTNGGNSVKISPIPNQNTTKIYCDFRFDEPIDLNKIIDTLQLIPLKMDPDNPIGKVHKIKHYSNHYYILDTDGKKLFCYNSDGSFHYCINAHGKGPTEYSNINDFTINKKDNEIILYDLRLQKFVAFDIKNGNYKNHSYLHKNFSFLSFAWVKGEKYLTNSNFTNLGKLKGYYNLRLIDNKGKNIRDELSFNSKWENYISAYAQNKLQEYKSNIQYSDISTRTVYEYNVENLTLEQRYVLDFGNYNISTDKLNSKRDKGTFSKNIQSINHWVSENNVILGPTFFLEANEFVLYQGLYKNQAFCWGFYCKKTMKNRFGNKITPWQNLSEILQNGFFDIMNDEFFISVIYPIQIHSYFNKKESSKIIHDPKNQIKKTIYELTTPTDNPIIALVKLKEF